MNKSEIESNASSYKRSKVSLSINSVTPTPTKRPVANVPNNTPPTPTNPISAIIPTINGVIAEAIAALPTAPIIALLSSSKSLLPPSSHATAAATIPIAEPATAPLKCFEELYILFKKLLEATCCA